VGDAKLPSPAEMEADTQEEARYRREVLGMPDKYFHKMGTLQWDYNRELARLGNLEPLPDATENLYMAVRTEDEKCPCSESTGNVYRFIKEGKQIW